MQDKPQALLTKPQLPIVPLPGSRPLSNARHEHYCRLRSLLCPKGQALREAGMRAVKNHDAVSNATRLERRQDVRDRIAFLVRQEEEVLAEKRRRIEEQLWAICGGNIQDFFIAEDLNPTETSNNPAEIANNPGQGKVGGSPRARVVPRPLTELDPETAKLIEDITFDSKGRAVPRLYSKAWANAELRKMLNISAKEAPRDITQLSDAELIETLARQARELGVQIDLSYDFGQPKKTDE
jgi:hypothetical protein